MESEPSSCNTLASEYALRVALQTMKERCLVLQRRLTVLEEDNQGLRERVEQGKPASLSQNNNGAMDGEAAELMQLRVHVAELNRQKQQLSEHINMVSNENRKLWSRLSQIAKDKSGRTGVTNEQDILGNVGDQDDLQASPQNGNGASQNLIRSKTFTQHSPNPNLRHKLIPNGSELSMEEVALDGCDKNGEVGEENKDYVTSADGELGFAYLNVDDGASEASSNEDADFTSVAKKCIDGLQEMRREAIKQQQELNSALAVLESKIALQPCTDCVKNKKKPETADKSLETDESLSEGLNASKQPEFNGVKACHRHDESEEVYSCSNEPEDETFLGVDAYYDKVQDVFNIEPSDRLCPLCGKKFDNTVPWETFQLHVESHFIDRDVDF
ncbi:protein spindle-F [Rhagoletis pomonella]|uniref:protein spindle-F n=1 Tax=Rhagoletis pomonella TaxID=28610 RepID=UPI00177B8CE8|nr:protein spindle-F [Rhagoletis pomonella]